MNHKYANRVKSMKNTRLGKLVCRLMGEEQGAVMMEYVIVAVMIAAAVALGCYFFGGAILDLFGITIKSADGRHEEASTELNMTVRQSDDKRIENAKQNQQKFSDVNRQ